MKKPTSAYIYTLGGLAMLPAPHLLAHTDYGAYGAVLGMFWIWFVGVGLVIWLTPSPHADRPQKK